MILRKTDENEHGLRHKTEAMRKVKLMRRELRRAADHIPAPWICFQFASIF